MNHWRSPWPHRRFNWNKQESFIPTLVSNPADSDELAAAIVEARSYGFPVTVRGTGHSFRTTVASHMLVPPAGDIRIDRQAKTVSASGGTRIKHIVKELARQDLALVNLGDVGTQTIAGAVATCTHGTGSAFSSLASAVVSAEFVTGSGERIYVERDANPELFYALLVPGGAFSVIASVTLKVREVFHLRESKTVYPIPTALDRIDEIALHDRYTLLCWPHGDGATERIWTETEEPRDGSVRRLLHESVEKFTKENLVFGRVAWLVSRAPGLAGFFSRTIVKQAKKQRERVDSSHRILQGIRNGWLAPYGEAEYDLPFANARSAMTELIALVRETNVPLVWPLFMRIVRADEIPMSPFFKDHSANGVFASVSIIYSFDMPGLQSYLDRAESILVAHEGRPHWGKFYGGPAENFERFYGDRLHRWRAIAGQHDPDSVFRNSYYNHLLGF